MRTDDNMNLLNRSIIRLNTIVELFRTDDITDTTCLYELQR